MKGHALLVGVDVLSNHYQKGNEFDLDVQRNFVNILEVLKRDFPDINLANQTQKINLWSEFTAALDPFIKSTDEETFLFIYVCCHSAIVNDQTTKQELNFLCFTEQMVYVNEWKRQLSQIHENYNVVIILDTCYGENFLKQEITRSPTFQEIFENNYEAFYKEQIERNECSLSNANFYLLSSTDERGIISPNHFSTVLKNLYLFAGSMSAINFYNELLKVLLLPKPALSLPWHSKRNYFNTHTLFGKSLAESSTFMNGGVIEIDEKGNKTSLGVRVTQPHAFHYTDTYHWDVLAHATNPDFIALQNKIINLYGINVLNGIELIGVVTVNIDHLTGKALPVQPDNSSFVAIRGLKSLGCDGNDCSIMEDCDESEFCYESNCLIVLVASDNGNNLVGRKRTKGKVSNKLG